VFLSDEPQVVLDELFEEEMAPFVLVNICPVDIILAAYWVLLCMLDQVLKTALVAMKPNISIRSGTDARANSRAIAPRRQPARPRIRRKFRGPDVGEAWPGLVDGAWSGWDR
jgi:hypothetical protein